MIGTRARARRGYKHGNDKLEGLERLRDVQKLTMLFEDKAAFQIIMGVEGQADIHYYMPVRCMELEYQLLANDQWPDEWNEALKDNKVLLRLLKEYSLI